MPQGLKGKTAVITGGTSGIGLAVARKLVEAGVNVIVAGRRAAEGHLAVATLGGPTRFLQTDVRSEPDVQRLMNEAVAAFGGIDLLFNNAGVEGPLAPIDAYPVEALDDVLSTNLKGAFLCLKHAVPVMVARGGGVVVSSASTVGTVLPFPMGALYGATKAALVSLTQAAAASYGPSGVHVYAICPWITDTPMIDRLTAHRPEAKAQFGGINPSGRIVSSDEVAGVVHGLFSHSSPGWASGDGLLIDAGGIIRKLGRMSAVEAGEVS